MSSINKQTRPLLATTWENGTVSFSVHGVRANNVSPMTVTGTNTFIVHDPGTHHALIVDPGPPDVEHLRRVLAVVAERHAQVGAIMITHTHADHIAGTDLLLHLIEHGADSIAPDELPAELDGTRFLPQAFGRRTPAHFGNTCVPVYASDLGNCPAGAFEPFTDAPKLSIVALPGHSDDMVGLLVHDERQLLTSDLVFANWSSVVPYGDGNLGDYFESLRVVQELVRADEVEMLLPAHGYPINQPIKVIEGYRAHRKQRLAQVREIVDAAGLDAQAVVQGVYGDIDDPLLLRASYSTTFAQLEYLATERGEAFEPDLSLIAIDPATAARSLNIQ